MFEKALMATGVVACAAGALLALLCCVLTVQALIEVLT
jgi:hypothetical protein